MSMHFDSFGQMFVDATLKGTIVLSAAWVAALTMRRASAALRHLVWVQVGIARGTLECLLGLVYLGRGVVTWPQAGLGIVAAALMTIAYLALYPRGRFREEAARAVAPTAR